MVMVMVVKKKNYFDNMAEWLRRWTANPLGSARAGSNPVIVVFHVTLDS